MCTDIAHTIKLCFGKQIENGSWMIFNHNHNLKPKEELLTLVKKKFTYVQGKFSSFLKI